MLSSYPKVYAVGHPAIAGLFDAPVYAEEKVDGSQLSFCVWDGQLMVRSRSKQIDIDGPDDMFKLAVEQLKDRQPVIPGGIVFRGEYLMRPKHNVLAYDRTPKDNIILFDAMVGPEDYATKADLEAMADDMDFETVPTLSRGVTCVDDVRRLMDTVSVLGGQKIEGLVFKREHGDRAFLKDAKPMVGKYVSEAFKEIHRAAGNPLGRTRQKDAVGELVSRYRCQARWQKAVQHLKEAGNLKQEPADIGPLIKEIQDDLIQECGDEMKNYLFERFKKDVLRQVIQGMPQWYKSQLLEHGLQGSSTSNTTPSDTTSGAAPRSTGDGDGTSSS